MRATPNNTEIREHVEPLFKGRSYERVTVLADVYCAMLGVSMTRALSRHPTNTYQVTRQKLRQVHSQFIARIVASKLES